ncbi:MAG: hypothetical protein JW882_18180 [Deltaproteobacteria bacterium]|nr:hypothetical protein [Deltaproteobacteria bacterium]
MESRITTIRNLLSLTDQPGLWIVHTIKEETFHLLNLDHPEVEAIILSEIDSGVDVYYDCRWEATEVFCRFLLTYQGLIAHRSALILGAGIGLETLVIGRLSPSIYVNDLAPVALDLCALQLEKNGIHHYECLPGRYETLPCPEVDIVVGSYLIYNAETARTMQQFLDRCFCPVLLMNEPLQPFRRFLRSTSREKHDIILEDSISCVLFESDLPRSELF